MPTPAYIPHSPNALTPSTGGSSVPPLAQSNDNALADELSLLGMLGWSSTVTRTAGRLTQVVMSRGSYRTRCDYTYVPSGPAAGRVQDVTHYWSNDGGVTWALRTDTGVASGKQTFNYDGAGNLTGTTWS